MFSEISPRYDFLNHFLSGGTDYYWRWKAVRSAPMTGDAPVLDVCTGTGDLAIAYWKRSGRTLPVVATDFTREMLTRANLKLAGDRYSGADDSDVAFLEADTQKLPFANDCFQIVSVAFGLRNVTNTGQGLDEMFRVCKPGGHVVILEFSMPRRRLVRKLYGFYFRHVLPRIGQLLARNRQSAYNYLPSSVAEFPQGEELAAIMRSRGMEQVTWTELTFGVATLYCGTKPQR